MQAAKLKALPIRSGGDFNTPTRSVCSGVRIVMELVWTDIANLNSDLDLSDSLCPVHKSIYRYECCSKSKPTGYPWISARCVGWPSNADLLRSLYFFVSFFSLFSIFIFIFQFSFFSFTTFLKCLDSKFMCKFWNLFKLRNLFKILNSFKFWIASKICNFLQFWNAFRFQNSFNI
jgi:hypothetical protein